jgi:hypothetical protein
VNGPPASDITETRQIDDALDDLLIAAIEWRQRKRNPTHALPQEGGVYTMRELLAEADAAEEGSPTEQAAAALLVDPVGSALRDAIYVLGERLCELGGLPNMLDTLQRVADRDPASHGRRTDILDRCWEGLGGWTP